MDDLASVTNTPAALRSVAAAPPELDTVVVAEALDEAFGLRGELRPLVSERDQNFRFRTPNGRQYVVKVVSTVENPGVTDFQIAALRYLEERGVAGVPHIVRNVSGGELGNIRSQCGNYRLRVTSWLDGEPIVNRAMDESIAAAIGLALGRLDRALSDFTHQAENPVLLWDMQCAGELVALTDHIPDRIAQQQVRGILETFRDTTLKLTRALPQQVIHNDANPSNLLLHNDAIAIIDFGDILHFARIVDVAIAAAYLRDPGNPLRFIAPFVSAYHDANALQSAEIEVLYDLIQTRLATTITILYWRMSARDQNDPYRQQTIESEQDAFDFLQALALLGRTAFTEAIKSALGRG